MIDKANVERITWRGRTIGICRPGGQVATKAA
jgi:hypothetical protein